jgi:5'(3')-deoxyribonucleotidase
MIKRYAIDFDGTILDTIQSKVDWAQRVMGVTLTRQETYREFFIPRFGKTNYNAMGQDAYGRESTLSAKPIRGAVEAIKKLSEIGEVYLLTKRHSDHFQAAIEWFKQNGLHDYMASYLTTKPEGIKEHISKSEMAVMMEATALIDDQLSHLENPSGITSEGLKKILLLHSSRQKPQEKPTDVILARDWNEVLKLVS